MGACMGGKLLQRSSCQTVLGNMCLVPVKIYTFFCLGVPGTPSGFNYTEHTSTTVTLTWMPLALSGVMYIIEYQVGGTMMRRDITDGTTILTVSGLQPDTEYQFMISSYKDGKRSLPARIQARTIVAGMYIKMGSWCFFCVVHGRIKCQSV